MEFYNDPGDLNELIPMWRDEAEQLADKYGQHAAVSTYTALFDDRAIDFKRNPSPDNWQSLIRAMYMLQHAKNNYTRIKPEWMQQLLREAKNAETSLDAGEHDA